LLSQTYTHMKKTFQITPVLENLSSENLTATTKNAVLSKSTPGWYLNENNQKFGWYISEKS